MTVQFKAKNGSLLLTTIISFCLVAFFFLLPYIYKVHAAINKQINFQGKLVNSDGTNVTTGKTVIFTIYDAPSDGSALWTETDAVTVTDGVFRTTLGDGTTLPGSIDFNSDNIYLGIKVSTEVSEMSPRIRFAAVPYAFNAAKVAGLTVTDTTGTLTIPNGKTIQFADAFSTSGAFPLTLTTTNSTNVTLPTTGTLITNTALAVQTITSTQSTGTILGIADSTGLTGAIKGLVVTLSGGNAFDQTGLEFNLSNASGSNLNDIVGTAGSWKVSKGGALTVASCSGCGGGGGGTLQQTYDAGSAGDQIITLDAVQDSIVVRNPSSSGSDASYTFKVEQLNTGVANNALYIDNRGTGVGFRIDDESGDTTPFIVDSNGRVGIGTNSISNTAATERLLQVGSETKRGNSVTYGEVVTKGLKDITALTDIKDVFLYDTTADSDGGRWIDWATTDRLSWYTESFDDGPNDPCNITTDDRCYSQSFPRKAILVVTGSALYIFDATNNVMWMKFDQDTMASCITGPCALGANSNNNPSSVTALNGVIYVGAKGTASGGLYALDFVNDRMWNYNATNRAGADVGISGRNAVVTYASDAKTTLQLDPIGTSAEWMNINDVAAVNVNSSLSPITIGAAANLIPGQGQTFVALATDSGVTIINLAAQKLLQYADVAADNYEAVALTKSGKMYALNSTTDQLEKWDNIDSDKVSEVPGTYTSRWTSAVGPALAVGTVAIQTDAPDALEVVERGSLAQDNMDLIYVGHNLGLTEIHDHATVTNGWSKFYNTTRQTMLMPNAIDAALPLDDTTGTVAQDASFNNTDMEYKGTVALGVNGVRGKGVGLNGTGYLCSNANAGTDSTCDNDPSFNSTTTAFNISMWFKHSTTAPAAPQVLYEKCYNTTPAATVGCVVAYMNTTTGTITAAIDATTTFTQFTTYDVTATSSLAYNDDQWHFLLMSRDNANDMNVYIDGQALNLSNATGQTATVDAASQVMSIGASCAGSANCATGANFWDGSIDDFTFSSGATTVSNLLSAPARRLYNDARPLVGKKTITVTDASAATDQTLEKTGSGWIPNEFAGLIVSLTGGAGSGQSRRVIGNTTDTLTVSPMFDTPPDTTTDFEVDPESLYGASDIVNAIGITAESPLGEARMMCAGTNSTTDTGGVTCYNHQAGPNVVAEVFHADAKKTDDFGDEWTGTDYDDIKSIDLSGRALIIGSMGHMYSRTEDVRLGQGLDYLANQLFNIRGEMIQDGIILTGSQGLEVGFTGGADLAERYYSHDFLDFGEVVAIDSTRSAGIKRSDHSYQSDVLGVVSTEPGAILGENGENSYPVALVGRVPVKISLENGTIKAGDRLTSGSVPGHAIKAVKSGRVLGTAIEDLDPETISDCPSYDEGGSFGKCGRVMMFVNLTDYLGAPVELVMEEKNQNEELNNNGLEDQTVDAVTNSGLVSTTVQLDTPSILDELPANKQKILAFLKELKAERDASINSAQAFSEIFTDRVSAVNEIITPHVITDLLTAKRIRADSIEGLEILTNKISYLNDQNDNLNLKTEALAGEIAGIATSSAGLSTEVKNTGSSKMAVMGKLTIESAQITLDLSVLGKLSADGGLTVGGPAHFAGETLFDKLVTFVSNVIFKGKITFEEVPTFNKDTAGFALIKKGERKIKVEFEKEYQDIPVITANKIWNIENDTLSVIDKLDGFFLPRQDYLIAGVTKKGFTIVLEEPAVSDIRFNWIAIAVAEPKTFESSASASINDAAATFDLSKIKPSPWVEPSLSPSPVHLEPTISIISNVASTPVPTSVSLSPTVIVTPALIPTIVIPTLVPQKTVTVLPNEYGFVRLRETPTIDGVEMGRLEIGTRYQFLEKKYDWYQIKTGDRTGWVSGIYVSEN